MIYQDEIHTKCCSKNREERLEALSLLRDHFESLPNKNKSWKDFQQLVRDKDRIVKINAAIGLSHIFKNVPDKKQAFKSLCELLKEDEEQAVRFNAIITFGAVFQHIPNKKQAWNYLHKLATDKRPIPEPKRPDSITSAVAYSLGFSFFYVPDIEEAWNDLHKLTLHEEPIVRSGAAHSIGLIFQKAPYKNKAEEDLHNLAKDKDSQVRLSTTLSLGRAFEYISNKEKALNDLHKLTEDDDKSVRKNAAISLGSILQFVYDKEKTWNYLHKLTEDEENDVLSSVASILGSTFPHIPNKQQTLNDLSKLAVSKGTTVRINAIHSLGKISIFKASQAETEEGYKQELEKAIEFFEKASQESTSNNPSQFCLPFYLSFHTIIFKKQEAKEEVDRYLAEAKNAVKGSKSKELLLETVENLANALKEVQNLENMDLAARKNELNFYRTYCEQAAKLMDDTEEAAPFATATMRKGLPILDRKLKSLLEEIQEKAKTACRESQGTETEEIACAVSREVQKWEIGSQEEMTQKVEDAAYLLKSKVADLPENEYILNKIEVMRHERDLTKQYETLLFVIGQIPTVKVVPEDVVVENINKVGQDLGTKLDGLSQEMSEIRICLKPGIKEEIEISSGIDVLGTGAKHIVTIPLQEISYDELKDDLKGIKGRNITKLSRLPERLARRIKGYLLLHDREDLVEQLS